MWVGDALTRRTVNSLVQHENTGLTKALRAKRVSCCGGLEVCFVSPINERDWKTAGTVLRYICVLVG